MRIYAACLASYNNGVLHGAWIEDLEDKDIDDIQEEIAAMLRASPYPNVTVDCPDCAGTGRNRRVYAIRCAACDGAGTVPSAEEWAIHDFEDAPFKLHEYAGIDVIEKAIELHNLIEEHGDAFMAYIGHVGEDYASEEGFRDKYIGEYESERDWAEQWLEDTGQINEFPEHLRYYFDYDAYARDARIGGDIDFVLHEGSLYVFHS